MDEATPKNKFHYDHLVGTTVGIIAVAVPVVGVGIVETEVRMISEVVADEEASVEALIVEIEVVVVVATSEVVREVVDGMEVLDIKEVDSLEMVKDRRLDLLVIYLQGSLQVLLVDQHIKIILVQLQITFHLRQVLQVHLGLSLQNKTVKNNSVEGMMMDDLIEGMTIDAVVTVMAIAIVTKIMTGKREVTEMEIDEVVIIIENVMKEIERSLIATLNDGDINKYRRSEIVCCYSKSGE